MKRENKMSDFTVSVNGVDFNVNVQEKVSTGFVQTKAWRDPEPHELETLWFNKIWEVIKDWDINVEGAYEGYCSATGNHVVAILDALVENKDEDRGE
jgi:hypothetical protein